MMNRLITFLFIQLLLISCDDRQSGFKVVGDKVIFKNFYDNGNLRSLIEYNKDTILDGKMIQYHYNGNVKRVANYIDGELQGVDSVFYESGNPKVWGTSYNGKYVGHAYACYDTLFPMVVSDDIDTFIVNYPVISKYKYFNSNGVNTFESEHSKKMELKDLNGRLIALIYLPKKSGKANEEFYMEVELATPPTYNFEFELEVIYKGDVVKSIDRKGIGVNNNIVTFRYVPAKPGEYRININYWSSTSNQVRLKDTQTVNYLVTP